MARGTLARLTLALEFIAAITFVACGSSTQPTTSSNSLKLRAVNGSSTFWKSQALQRDRWYDLTYRVKLSQDASVGFVEVWLNGVQQTLSNGNTRAYGQTMQAAQSYLKAGIYRSKSSTGTSIIEHDAIDVGTSLAAVAAGPTGSVLFRGDFENGFEGWYVQSLPERISLVSSNVFEGTQAARFEVREGDVEPRTGSQRSEVSGPTFNEGQDLYINDAIRIPSANTFSTPWQIIQQLHEVNWSGSPGLAIFLDSNNSLKLASPTTG